MNYDPCHCNYRNDLFFEAKLSSTSTLSFKLNGTAIQDLDSYGRSGVNGKTSVNGLQPAISVYKDASNAFSLINGILNDPTGNKPDKFQNFLSYLPVVGKALTLSDFFLGLFKNNKPLSATPLSFKINLTANGTINYTPPYKPISLNVPGSYQASVASSAIPYYNNGLGVFTLIKTPTVKRYSTGYSQVTGYCSENDNYTMSYEYSSVIKLAEPIKYAINPNAGVSLNPADIDIRLNWVFFSDGTLYNTVFGESDVYNAGCFGEYEMYCNGIEEWDCNGNYTLNNENGYHTVVSGVPALKVTAKLKTLSSGQDFVFTTIYKCNQIGGTASDFTFDITPGSNNEHIPSAIACSTNFIPQATTAEIKAICNSTAYIAKVQQYQRTDSVRQELLKPKVNSNSFVLSPNPASTYTNSLLNLKINSNVKILIYDIAGRFIKQLFNGKLLVGEYNLRNDLVSLPNGTYLVTAEFDDQRVTQKLILQK
jgi:Secretion system C-terminal sorting domain